MPVAAPVALVPPLAAEPAAAKLMNPFANPEGMPTQGMDIFGQSFQMPPLQAQVPSQMVLGVPWPGAVLPPWMTQFGMRAANPMMQPFPMMPGMPGGPVPGLAGGSPYAMVGLAPPPPAAADPRRLSPIPPRQQNSAATAAAAAMDYSSSSESDSPTPSRAPSSKNSRAPTSPGMDNSKLLALALATGAAVIPPPTAGGPVQLEIYHKPRGSQGEWKLVYHGQNLRVTKQRGKLVRLVVRSVTRYDWDACRVKLLIRSGEDEVGEDGEIRPRWIESTAREALAVDKRQVTEERDPDSRGTTIFVHQLAVKVFPTRSTLAFRVECFPMDQPNERLVCTSVEMHTHDSGRRD